MTSINDFMRVANVGGRVLQDPGSEGGLKATGTGLKGKIVGWWKTRSMSTAQKSEANQQIMDSFVQAFRDEYGDNYANMTSSILSTLHAKGKPLKGRVIRELKQLVDSEKSRVQDFNQGLGDRVLARGNPETDLNCLDSICREVFEEFTLDLDVDTVFSQEKIESLRQELTGFIAEQSRDGEKPLISGDVRTALKERVTTIVSDIHAKLEKLDTLSMQGGERDILYNKIVTGQFLVGNNPAYDLTLMRLNAFIGDSTESSSPLTKMMDSIMEETGMNSLLSSLGVGELKGEHLDISAEVEKAFIKLVRSLPGAKTEGVSVNQIQTSGQDFFKEFLGEKLVALNTVKSLEIEDSDIEKKLARYVVDTETIRSPEQVQGLWNMREPVANLLETIGRDSSAGSVLQALKSYANSVGDTIHGLPENVRNSGGDIAFRSLAMELGIHASGLDQTGLRDVFNALGSGTGEQLIKSLGASGTQGLNGSSGGVTVGVLNIQISNLVRTLGDIAGLDLETIGEALDFSTAGVPSRAIQEELFSAFDLIVVQNDSGNYGIRSINDVIGNYHEAGVQVQEDRESVNALPRSEQQELFHKEDLDEIFQASDWSIKEKFSLSRVMDHPSNQSLDRFEKRTLSWIIRGSADSLLEQTGNALDPPTVEDIWQGVFNEPAPGGVNQENLARKIIDSVDDRYMAAVEDQPGGSEKKERDLELALNQGLSWQKAIDVSRPQAKVSMEDFTVPTSLSSLRDYTMANAYGQTVDIHRWADPTRIVILDQERQEQYSLDPNHDSKLSRRNGSPTVDDPIITDLLGQLREYCANSEEQVQRVSQFLTQASTVLFRMAGAAMGIPINEHGAYSFTMTPGSDGDVDMRIDIVGSEHASGFMNASIHRDGSYSISAFEVTKK